MRVPNCRWWQANSWPRWRAGLGPATMKTMDQGPAKGPGSWGVIQGGSGLPETPS